jgi:hypothetical protein
MGVGFIKKATIGENNKIRRMDLWNREKVDIASAFLFLGVAGGVVIYLRRLRDDRDDNAGKEMELIIDDLLAAGGDNDDDSD